MTPAHDPMGSSPRPSGPAPRRGAPWLLAWCVAAAVGAAAVALGWDRGPDPLVDFGRELYVPWRLTEGEVLHRDLAWFNGPLGPWVLEGWMRTFGVSLDAVQALNALVVAVTAWMLARIVLVIAGGLAAWVGTVLFLTTFAVAQQEAVGNFLFLAPYSHGITFGFTAGLGALLALRRFAERGTRGAAVAAGVALGLSFLTKAEVFLGSAAGAGVMVAAMLVAPGAGPRGRGVRLLGGLAVGFALPLGLAGLRFAAQLGTAEVPMALAGTWVHAFDPAVADMPFYRMMRGTHDLRDSLARLAITTAAVAGFVTLVMGAARVVERRVEGPGAAALLAFGSAAAATVGAFLFARLKWMLLPLAVFLPGLVALLVARTWRRRGEGLAARDLLLLGFAAFGAGLLPKVALVPLARQYGFVLSVPGALLLVCLLVRWIPDAFARRGARPLPLAAAGAAVALVFAAMNANATRNWFGRKTVAVGGGADRIWSDDWRGPILSAALSDVSRRLGPEEELLVLPEGITLNYLARRRTPTRLVNFMPPELAMFDEAEVIADLDGDPPQVVLLVQRPTDIYGPPFFGQGYGEALLAWVRAHYEPRRRIGEDPFTPGEGHFGVTILERR